MAEIQLTTCQGQAIASWLDDLARLRIRVFRDFPYLYDGDLDYEAAYLDRYARNPRSLFVLAFDGETLVGTATGQPLPDEVCAFRAPFVQAGYRIDEVFYYGESVLLPVYRGRGIGKAFMTERERHAAREGFSLVAFCAVERPDDHPLRPAGYAPLHGFWRAQGYERRPDLTTSFRWKDLDQAEETDKTMVFWLKSLA